MFCRLLLNIRPETPDPAADWALHPVKRASRHGPARAWRAHPCTGQAITGAIVGMKDDVRDNVRGGAEVVDATVRYHPGAVRQSCGPHMEAALAPADGPSVFTDCHLHLMWVGLTQR
jgi:hypothetical protein